MTLSQYQDGLYLTYYHGAAVNHIQKYEGRIYFVCDPSQFGTPVFAGVYPARDTPLPQCLTPPGRVQST